MPTRRLLVRPFLSPAAIVLLLITAIVGGGFEIRPAPPGGFSIASDDHAPDPQPREESPEESAEDEESESAKHAAPGSAVAIEGPGPRVGVLLDYPARPAFGSRLDAAPIRGPPSRA